MFQAAIRQHLPCDKQPANLAILCPVENIDGSWWFYPKYATKDTIQIDPSADHSVIGFSIFTAVGTVFWYFWHATLSLPSVVVFSLVEFHHNSEIQRTWIPDRLWLSPRPPPARHFLFGCGWAGGSAVLPMEGFTRVMWSPGRPLMVCLF